MTAADLLTQAADLLAERGREYDNPDGERSMASAVAAFRAITRTNLREEDGWLLMLLIKLVRDQTARDRTDSVQDGIAYAALRGEAILRSRRGTDDEAEAERCASSDPAVIEDGVPRPVPWAIQSFEGGGDRLRSGADVRTYRPRGWRRRVINPAGAP